MAYFPSYQEPKKSNCEYKYLSDGKRRILLTSKVTSGRLQIIPIQEGRPFPQHNSPVENKIYPFHFEIQDQT
jgi:hypothetical protein